MSKEKTKELEPKEGLQEEEIKKLKELLNDPKEQLNALHLAKLIQEYVSKNWFTFSKFIKKTKELPADAERKLATLRAYGLLAIKIEDGEQKFKISIGNDLQIKVMMEEVDSLNTRIKYLRNEIEKLQKSSAMDTGDFSSITKELQDQINEEEE